jgi:hypothetical protein
MPSLRRLLLGEAVVFQFIVVHELASLQHTPELLLVDLACAANLCDRRHRRRLDQDPPDVLRHACIRHIRPAPQLRLRLEFVINHGKQDIEHTVTGHDLLTGEPVPGLLKVGAGAVRVIREEGVMTDCTEPRAARAGDGRDREGQGVTEAIRP